MLAMPNRSAGYRSEGVGRNVGEGDRSLSKDVVELVVEAGALRRGVEDVTTGDLTARRREPRNGSAASVSRRARYTRPNEIIELMTASGYEI